MDANHPTAKLLAGQAVCKMHTGKFAEAEKLLEEAVSKDHNACALANMIVCGLHLHRPTDLPAKYLS